MEKKRAMSLLVGAVLCIAGPAVLMAQVRRGPVPRRAPERLGLPQPEGRRGGGPGGTGITSHSPRVLASALPSAAIPLQRTEADDAVSLSVSKTWDSGAGTWQLTMTWSGGTSPYTVSYSTDPSFQRNDRTLEMNTASSALSFAADATASLECFAVTDADGVSPAVQGMGSDPYPDLPAPTIQQDGLWWGDSLTLNGGYLDLMPEETFLGLAARQVQASAVTDGGNGFATAATFTIPDDGRGSYAFLSTHGQSPGEAPFIHLSPRGVSDYSNIHSVIFAPQTGHIWVAADGKVDELDVFEHDPVIVRSITTYTKPYLSQCTADGRMLVADGVASVSEIGQIDVNSGAVTLYANTTDTSHTPNFTRSILPVGIAVDPDGSAAYIADATGGEYASTPVRFPQNNATAITDNYGNWPYWYFPDPCGIEVGLTHQLLLGSAEFWVGYVTAPGGYPQNTETYYDADTCGSTDTCWTPNALIVDRDVSTSSYDRYYYNNAPWAMAYNQNAIASLTESTPASNLGADVVAFNGKLSIEPQWEYSVRGNAPKPVILNNAGQSQPYPTTYQVADRLVKLTVQGWAGMQIHLTLIDPRDTAGYAPSGGWPAKIAYPTLWPYLVYDNDVWTDASVTDYGLTTQSSGALQGTPPVLQLDPTPVSDNTATFYLKLPPRYAGDNWQVLVQKRKADGTLISDKKPTISSVFTGWKRVYIEKDRMFRRGGLLAMDAAFGQSTVYVAKTWDAVNSKWVRADNLAMNDKVAVFDTGSPFEGAHDEGCIIGLNPTDDATRWIVVTLGNLQCQGGFTLTHDYSCSVDTSGNWTFASDTRSAALGVIYSTVQDPPGSGKTITDTATNQINGSGSAFYDADMRNAWQPFDDAFTQFIFQSQGSGAVPYLPPGFFDAITLDTGDCTNPVTAQKAGYDFGPWYKFGYIWFSHHQQPNWLWLVGAVTPAPIVYQGSPCPNPGCPSNYLPEIWGYTASQYAESFVFTGAVESYCPEEPYLSHAVQGTTNHELGHEFNVDPSFVGNHCDHCDWKADGAQLCSTSFTTCSTATLMCLMDGQRERWSTTHYFDRNELECGDPVCPNGHAGCCVTGSCSLPGNGSIRQLWDPIQGGQP